MNCSVTELQTLLRHKDDSSKAYRKRTDAQVSEQTQYSKNYHLTDADTGLTPTRLDMKWISVALLVMLLTVWMSGPYQFLHYLLF